ncbi:MAG: tetratricopeptide repeat protein [Alphaproteobacteria bacterium]|nr:tetratricopeptide repeat protein [Alphaproteobacteria bacterium]
MMCYKTPTSSRATNRIDRWRNWNRGAVRESLRKPRPDKLPATIEVAAVSRPQSIAIHPGALDRAMAVLRAGDAAQAVELIDGILDVQPALAEAWMVRGLAGHRQGRQIEALSNFHRALALNPALAAPHLHIGRKWARRPDWTNAIAAFRCAVMLDPDSLDGWAQLAAAYVNGGQHEQARVWLERLIQRWPGHGRAHANLALIHRRAGRYVRARDHFHRAIALKPSYSDAHFELAMLCFAQDDWPASADALRRTLALRPDRPHAHLNLGVVLRKLRRDEEAVEALLTACRVMPEFSVAPLELGLASLRLGRLEMARQSLHRALVLDPTASIAHHNLGAVLNRLGDLPAAATALACATALEPSLSRAWILLGLTSIDLERLEQANACFLRAIALWPSYNEVYFYLAKLQDRLGCSAAAIDNFRRSLALEPNYPDAVWEVLLTMTADDGTEPREVLAFQQRQAARWEPPGTVPPHSRRAGDAERCLRIGYVGRSYASIVNEFTTTTLRVHDPRRVVQFAFAGVIGDPGAVPDRDGIDCLVELKGLSEEQAATLIRRHEIDILVDMDACRPGSRLGVFAWRPAPIQVTWIETFYTTGLPAMDYLLTDAVHAPLDDVLPIVEAPARLPDCRFCYAPPIYAPETVAPPCLARGFVTFGSFNALNKLTEPVIRLWSEIMQGVAESRLLLKRRNLAVAEVRDAYIRRFAAYGISNDRLIMRGHSAHPQMLAEYGDVDIALDPFPYNGGRTSCEALWMGLPLVAMRGQRMIARQSASLLQAICRAEWIAETPEQYREIAHRLAHAPAVLAAYRAEQRGRIKQSPLTDARRFAANLEAVYRDMWRRWCGGSAVPGRSAG